MEDRAGAGRPTIVGVGLERAHRADLLGGVGGGIGERVLRHARLLPRTERPKPTSGNTISGMAPSTNPDSFGLVATIMIEAPRNSTRLRSAIDTDAPTAALIWVVSAVSRESNSPLCERSKKAGDSAARWLKTWVRRSATMRSPSVVTR